MKERTIKRSRGGDRERNSERRKRKDEVLGYKGGGVGCVWEGGLERKRSVNFSCMYIESISKCTKHFVHTKPVANPYRISPDCNRTLLL